MQVTQNLRQWALACRQSHEAPNWGIFPGSFTALFPRSQTVFQRRMIFQNAGDATGIGEYQLKRFVRRDKDPFLVPRGNAQITRIKVLALTDFASLDEKRIIPRDCKTAVLDPPCTSWLSRRTWLFKDNSGSDPTCAFVRNNHSRFWRCGVEWLKVAETFCTSKQPNRRRAESQHAAVTQSQMSLLYALIHPCFLMCPTLLRHLY